MRRLVSIAATFALLALPVAGARAAAPTDPSAASQEPLAIMKVGQALDRLGAPLADVPVLVPDTGADLDHPDLAPRLFSLPAPVPAPNPENEPNPPTVTAGAPGWDLLGTDRPSRLRPDADPTDPLSGSGQGTLMSGVLGAAWGNGQGGAGVAPNARFVVLRTCWSGDRCHQYVQAAATDWAADRGARVVAIGWLLDSLQDDLRESIERRPGVLFVAVPSGSGGAYDTDGDVRMPCGLDAPNVICATASSPSDEVDCGAYGPTSVDVAAPTRNNVTTRHDGTFATTGCDTRLAASAVAGVATILFGMDPSATAADVKAAILDSARRVPGFAGRTVTGGVVDADAAVALFQSRRGIAPRPPAPPPVADTTRPSLRFSVRPRRFRAGGTGVRLSRTATAIAFRSRVSEPAVLFVRVQRARRLRSGRTRWVTAGTLSGNVPAGLSRVLFSGRGRTGRNLRPGLYRARAIATDAAGNRSARRSARFRIVPR